MSNTITINGITFKVEGGGISIHNGIVKVNGEIVKSGLSGIVKIKFKGDLANLRTDRNVECGNVHGDINTGGSVECGDVGGSVDAGGSVQAKNITGDIDAGGSVQIIK